MERKVVACEELDERLPVGALRVDAVQRYAHAYRLEASAAATADQAAEGSRQVSIEDDPFDYQVTKSRVLIIRRGGRAVMELGGKKAAALIPKLGRSDEADQQLLARVTGNYRRGNEKQTQKPR